MSEIADKAVDLAADAVGEIAEQAEGAEQTLRSLKGVKLSYTALGAVIGAAAGALTTYGVVYKRLKSKIQAEADEYVADQVAEMREHYHNKTVALENKVEKPKLAELVKERGYVSNDDQKPPLAVSPPAAVVQAAEEAREEAEPPPIPAKVAKGEVVAEERNVFRDRDPDAPQSGWNYERELRGRSPLAPYIIHVDEQEEMGYETVSLTYYEGDDVLCRADDSVIPEDERDKLLGEKNIVRFGHGSEDPSLVYIRNDQLELQFEVVRSPSSYQEEVAGFRHSDGRRRRDRHAFDDE